MTEYDGITLGELARQVRDVFSRLEGVIARLEAGQFVSSEVFKLSRENINLSIQALEKKSDELDREKLSRDNYNALEARVKELEDSRTWLVRLVGGFIILAVLGIALAAGGVPK